MFEIGAHPCIYLDSSSVIRQINREAHKTNNAVNYYKLNKIISDGNIPNDISFYKKITSLLDSNIFNSIITYETNNTTINSAQNIIKLFISNAYHNPSYVLMDQEVDHDTFFYAAQKILASKIVLVDPLFLDFQIGESLTHYIKSSCQVVSLGKRILLQKYEGEITMINQTPDQYVEELFNTINHFD